MDVQRNKKKQKQQMKRKTFDFENVFSFGH